MSEIDNNADQRARLAEALEARTQGRTQGLNADDMTTGKRDEYAAAREVRDADGKLIKWNSGPKPVEMTGEVWRTLHDPSVTEVPPDGVPSGRVYFGKSESTVLPTIGLTPTEKYWKEYVAAKYASSIENVRAAWADGLTEAIDNGEPSVFGSISRVGARSFADYTGAKFNGEGTEDQSAVYRAAHQYDTLASPPPGPIGDPDGHPDRDGSFDPTDWRESTPGELRWHKIAEYYAVIVACILGGGIIGALLIAFSGWRP